MDNGCLSAELDNLPVRLLDVMEAFVVATACIACALQDVVTLVDLALGASDFAAALVVVVLAQGFAVKL